MQRYKEQEKQNKKSGKKPGYQGTKKKKQGKAVQVGTKQDTEWQLFLATGSSSDLGVILGGVTPQNKIKTTGSKKKSAYMYV